MKQNNHNNQTNQAKPEKQASKSPIQFFPSVEEMESIDAISFLLIAKRGDGRTGRTTVSRFIVAAALRDRAFLLKHFPELKDETPEPVSRLLNAKG